MHSTFSRHPPRCTSRPLATCSASQIPLPATARSEPRCAVGDDSEANVPNCKDALRLLLTIVMTPSELCAHFPHMGLDHLSKPIATYEATACAVLREPELRRQLARHMHSYLGADAAYAKRSPAEVTEAFCRTSEDLSRHQCSALLWAIVQQPAPMCCLLAKQLTPELQTQWLRSPPARRACTRKQSNAATRSGARSCAVAGVVRRSANIAEE